MSRFVWIVALACVWTWGCGGGGESKVCEPGRQLECSCGGDKTGFQTCLEDGSGWSECDCACQPDCAGKECGPDGCGDTCGDCGNLEVCNDAEGTCDCAFSACGDECCGELDVCYEGACCAPDCAGRECGDDGCGGSCGECGSLEVCYEADGTCECAFSSCGDVCCGELEVCYEGACCAPDCTDKECGDDGCGGSCGECGTGFTCNELGTCVDDSCIPDCTGRDCGPDPVCGLNCGDCADWYVCNAEGQCELEEILCQTDQDCPGDTVCLGGVCVEPKPCDCNYDCDKSKNEVCNRDTHRCEPGTPPVNCQSDCDCYSGEECIGGECIEVSCDNPCSTDDDCLSGQTCVDGCCSGEIHCETREDCAGSVCLVCIDGICTAPPLVCQDDQDCCVGFHCNFGTCVPDTTSCQSDADCTDLEFPRCVEGECVQECINDIDCPLPGQVCIDNHCETPGCTPDECPQGQWCDTGDGQCKPGCDENEDCVPPDNCNLVTHECGQVACCGGCLSDQYCESFTCLCVENCHEDTDCPEGFFCGTYGRCWCTSGSCPDKAHCDPSTGECVQDTFECQTDADCPSGWTCNLTTNGCDASDGSGEGDFCFTDEQCDPGSNLLCDNGLFCEGCYISDPEFNPSWTCRYQCSLLTGGCSESSRECLYRHLGLIGLCIPPRCTDDSDCTNPDIPKCNTQSGLCGECLSDEDCSPGEVCNSNNYCTAIVWVISPGVGILPIEVTSSQVDFITLNDVREIAGEVGAPTADQSYTFSFLGDTLRVKGVDTNHNQVFDGNDNIICAAALLGLGAHTVDGVTPGTPRSEIHSIPYYSSPDNSANFPPGYGQQGSFWEAYFSEGLFIGYDQSEVAVVFEVSKQYTQSPNGTINPTNSTLVFGENTIGCDNGYEGGSTRDVHRGLFGESDWSRNLEMELDTPYGPWNINFYQDKYVNLGLDIFGAEDEVYIYEYNRTIAVAIQSRYYGTTEAGNGIWSTRSNWESEIGQPSIIVNDPGLQEDLYIYETASDKTLAVAYSNDGSSMDDVALLLILNYQEIAENISEILTNIEIYNVGW